MRREFPDTQLVLAFVVREALVFNHSWSPSKQLPEAISHDQRRRRQGHCPAPGRSPRQFVDAQQNHCATKQRPEGRDDEQPQENLVLGSQRGEEECVAAIGVSAALIRFALSTKVGPSLAQAA